MTPWQKRTTALTQRMADDMRLRNYSQKTIDAYTYHVGRFAEFLGRSPQSASPEDVRSFPRAPALDAGSSCRSVMNLPLPMVAAG